MALEEYKRKRDFRHTPEPAGKAKRRAGRSYVIQKHQASHLHYDFRLELDGVLKSWAVPKGPSLDPSQKRLAIHVEDHPVEYGKFEGMIPEGEYGGGSVMLWDRGKWEPQGDPEEGYRQGKLKFQLHGEKLEGGWFLVRRSGRGQSGKEARTWFLIKERDEAARPLSAGDVLEEEPLSVASGRDLDEIAAGKKKQGARKSKRRALKKPRARAKKKRASKSDHSPPAIDASLKAPRAKLPSTVEPQLATLAKAAPEGDRWLHEMKFDGYRMLCRIDGQRVRFISRNQQDWTDKFTVVAEAARELGARQALLDGEIVALEPDGTSDFQSLQNAFRDGRSNGLIYYVFDLLHLNGSNLMPLPLEERKRLLAEWLGTKAEGRIRYSDHIVGGGPEFFRQACKLKLEGIISKRRDRPYLPGRGYDWLKVKCIHTEEFVIGGYTEPSGQRSGFGALLIGYHNGQRGLKYAGKVGTGFSLRTLDNLTRRLQSLEQAKSPFDDLGRQRGAHWVRPQLVAQIEFSEWTRDGRLRHPSFQGLREDKPAAKVVRERAIAPETAIQPSRRA